MTIRNAVRTAILAMRDFAETFNAEWQPEWAQGGNAEISPLLFSRADLLNIAVMQLSMLSGRRQAEIRGWLEASYLN